MYIFEYLGENTEKLTHFSPIYASEVNSEQFFLDPFDSTVYLIISEIFRSNIEDFLIT